MLGRKNKSVLLVIVDTLRDDALDSSFAEKGRCFRAATAVSSAPWTLPSCTSIMTGNDARTHGHHWREPPLGRNRLVDSLPESYRKLGFVNNGALRKGSGVDLGFDWWRYVADFDGPFERAMALMGQATAEKPMLMVLHTNIVHDYYLPVADQFRPRGQTTPLASLDSRVVTWRDTDAAELAAVNATYAACTAAVVERVQTVLDFVRERDDFVTAVTADHGEGFDPDLGRVHHGGRVHQDVLAVPAFYDVPSSTRRSVRDRLSDALSSRLLFGTDVLPTLFELAGVKESPSPSIDGRSLLAGKDRTVMSEDRRYLYLNNRFRMNYHGGFKNMSPEEIEHNQRFTDFLSEPPAIRSFLAFPEKCVVTSLRLQPQGASGDTKASMEFFAASLLGSPVLIRCPDHLLAFELFDIRDDPAEERNLLLEREDGVRSLLGGEWAASVTVPLAGSREVGLAELLEVGQPFTLL